MRSRLPLLGILISLVALVGVIVWGSRQEAPELPDTSREWLALAGAIALYGMLTAIRAERWHALLRRAGARPNRADAYALTVIGYAGNNVLPARAGDAVRVVLLAPRAATTRRTVIGTLLAERLLDLAVIVVLFAVVGYAVLGQVSGADAGVLAAATAGGIALACAAVLLLRRNERVMGWIRPVLSSTLRLRGAHGAAMLALTLLIWLGEAGVWMAAAAAIDFRINPLEGMYLVALASVFSLIPSGPGYVGTQDAASAIGIKALGGSGSTAVSFILMIRFVLVVPITSLGFLLLAVRYGGLANLRRARAEAETGAG